MIEKENKVSKDKNVSKKYANDESLSKYRCDNCEKAIKDISAKTVELDLKIDSITKNYNTLCSKELTLSSKKILTVEEKLKTIDSNVSKNNENHTKVIDQLQSKVIKFDNDITVIEQKINKLDREYDALKKLAINQNEPTRNAYKCRNCDSQFNSRDFFDKSPH